MKKTKVKLLSLFMIACTLLPVTNIHALEQETIQPRAASISVSISEASAMLLYIIQDMYKVYQLKDIMNILMLVEKYIVQLKQRMLNQLHVLITSTLQHIVHLDIFKVLDL